MQLMSVDCHLQSIEQYPFIQTLNSIYSIFDCPKRRLIILGHILLYYKYFEENPKELMAKLKLYLDQNIDDEIKIHTLKVSVV